MRVPTRTTSEVVIAQLQKLGTQQAKLQKQVSTNQRIELPSDDPAAVGRLLGIGDEQARIAQFGRNIDVATSLAQAGYAGLKGVSDIATRAGELATLGAGIISAETAQAYASEVDQLLEQALQQANTRLNGDYLFSGNALDTEPFAVARDASGAITTVAYAGDAGGATIRLSETAAVNPRADGTANLGIRDLLNQLVALRDALQVNDNTAVSAAGVALEDATDPIVDAISRNGAVQLRLEAAKSLQTARVDDLERLASSEADTDFAATVVKLNQTTTTYEAALASASKIMNLSLLDYLR